MSAVAFAINSKYTNRLVRLFEVLVNQYIPIYRVVWLAAVEVRASTSHLGMALVLSNGTLSANTVTEIIRQ